MPQYSLLQWRNDAATSSFVAIGSHRSPFEHTQSTRRGSAFWQTHSRNGGGGRRGNAARSPEAPLELCRRAKVRHIIAVKAQWQVESACTETSRSALGCHCMDVLCTQSAQWTRCGREVKSLGTSCMATQLEPSHARQLHVAGAP